MFVHHARRLYRQPLIVASLTLAHIVQLHSQLQASQLSLSLAPRNSASGTTLCTIETVPCQPAPNRQVDPNRQSRLSYPASSCAAIHAGSTESPKYRLVKLTAVALQGSRRCDVCCVFPHQVIDRVTQSARMQSQPTSFLRVRVNNQPARVVANITAFVHQEWVYRAVSATP
jgi:hypothetical protein